MRLLGIDCLCAFLAQRPIRITAFKSFPKTGRGLTTSAISRRAKDMKKSVAAFLAIATIAGSLVSFTPAAQAGGGGVAAGVAAGIIGGAIVGGAIANSNPYYG